MGKYRALPVILAGATAALTGPPANGQDGETGMVLTFGLSSSLRSNDNLELDDPSPGTSTLWDNTLSFGLVNTTDVDRLQLDLSGIARLADTPGESDDFQFDDTRFGLAYDRAGANSRFGVTLDYSQIDLDFADPLRLIEDEINQDDLIIDDGEREIRAATLSYEMGVNDPLGFGLDLSYRERTFSGTTDPDLFDRETITAEAFARFRFSPVAEGRVTVFQSDYDAEDVEQTDRTTRSISFGLDYALDPATTLLASLGYADIEETTNLPTRTDETGAIGSLGLIRELRNGTAGVQLDSELSVTGRRNTLLFSRSYVLPTGALAVSVGPTHSDVGDTEAVGFLTYSQELPTGTITSTFERSFRTDDESEEIRVTRASLGYDMDINSVSGLVFEADYAEIRDAGTGGVNNVDTTSLRAAYRYALTPDWDLSAGYEYRYRDSDDDGTSDSNEVFLTLSREFSIRR